MGPLNQPKIDKIQAWTSVSCLVAPNFAGSSQDRPRVPQDGTMGTKIHSKAVKIKAWTRKIPLLCSPVSQNRPRVPQDTKVKPPIMPNDKFASQKYQDPLATLPRICDPETMSNDRGPAAEGVAHEITTIPGSLKLRKEYIGYMVHWKRDYSRILRSLVAPSRAVSYTHLTLPTILRV